MSARQVETAVARVQRALDGTSQARVREHTVDADDITVARFMHFLGANGIGPYSMHVSNSHRSATFRWVDAPGTRLDVSNFPSFVGPQWDGAQEGN